MRDSREALLPDDQAGELAALFGALADPTRARLISLLARRELCVGELAEALAMSLSAISHQLRLLHHLRIVRRRREGRQVYYALDDAHVATIFQCGLEHVRHGQAPGRTAYPHE
jgi:DNA-binding transcriptional ArsR family regulator